MITTDQMAALLEDALDDRTCDALAAELERDPRSFQSLLDQRRIDCLLRSVLASASDRQRLRESVLAAAAGPSTDQLQARVLAETIGWGTAAPWRSVPNAAATGKLQIPAGEPWRRFWATLASLRGSARGLVAAGAGLVVIGLALWLGGFGHRDPTPAIFGVLVEVVGVPTIRRSGHSQVMDATPGISVLDGDRLDTGDADRAEIRFRDGTRLRLAFNTSIELPLAAHPQLPDTNALLRPPEVRMLKGQVWTKVAKLTNAPAYAIRTDVATAIARGTEFGVSLRRIDLLSINPPVAGGGPPVTAVLTVKEGTVDFTNALGSVRATAMTESTARADSAPTEPRRLQTVQVVSLGGSKIWSLITSPLDWPEAAARLAGGGGSIGLVALDLPVAAGAPAPAAGATSEVRVARVLPNSPASRAGLQPGDIITALNGQPVTRASQLHRPLLIPSNGSPTQVGLDPTSAGSLTLRRGAESLSVQLTATLQPVVLPGPKLDPDQQTLLAEITRRWLSVAKPQSTGLPANDLRDLGAREAQGSSILRAAAENNLGIALELEDALGPAIRAYDRAVRVEPNVPLYRFNLGLALRKIGSFERAAEELAAAARLAPDSTPARKRLAEIHSLLGEDSAALAQTEAALQADPNDHGLWELKAQVLTKQRRAAEAADAGRRAAELDPTCPTALGLLAGALHLQGNLVEAEAVSREALESAPYDPLRHLDLGLILNDRGRLADGEQAFRRALELQPDFVVAHQNLGNVLANRRQWVQAEAAYRKAAELAPDDPSSFRELGQLARRQGRLDEAESLLQRALEVAPHDAESLGLLGSIRMQRGSLAEAENLIRRACEIEPGLAWLHNDLGEVLRERGQLDEAVASYRRAVALDSDDPSPRNNIAIIAAMRGRFAEAETELRALLDLAARNPRINPLNFLVNLAIACSKQGKLTEAEAFHRRALALEPDNPELAIELAWFLADHRLRLDEALTLARRAVTAQPDMPSFLHTLGWTLFQLGEMEEAERLLQKAVDLSRNDPSETRIREHLKEIQDKKKKP
ncbi:MAG: tetratricopeptide repeat protein [Verrucomicrobiales bacterium]|nr:tetratricopeptide repeat protein [Verrucomicrobiales bacterium]